MKTQDIEFWLGSEASLRVVQEAQLEMRGMGISDEDEPEVSRLLTFQDGVATVAVHGSLTSTDSFWNQIFGVTSYNEIRNAIVEAIEDEDVHSIVLDMDTPGGDAKGTNDLADFILEAKTRKPIDTYVSGSAFSAGYWIASATDNIYGAKMSEAGSIGVIAVLINQSKAMKDQGYEATVFRGGKYKALGNPYEKMTDKTRSVIQAKIDTMEGFFLDAVSENRNIPRSIVKAQVGEGLTFFAEDSVANGLMDKVISFDELFSTLVKRAKSGSAGRTFLTEEIDMKKKVLTAKAVAALASGATDVEALHEEVDTSAKDTAPEVKAEDAIPEAKADEAVKAEDTASLVAYLKDEVNTLRSSNATLSADLSKLTETSTTATANESALKAVVNEYVAGMSVGMGISAMNLESMDTSVLLSQYTEVRASFTARFKVGSSAAVEDDEPEASSGVSAAEKVSVKLNKI